MAEQITPEKVEIQDSPKPGKMVCVPAVVSMVSGILTYAVIFLRSLVNMDFIVAIIIAPITALIAIFTGANAKRKIRKSDGTLSGKKMANAGLWLGWIYIITCVLITVLIIILGVGIFQGIRGLLG
jgi:hypothetical protein